MNDTPEMQESKAEKSETTTSLCKQSDFFDYKRNVLQSLLVSASPEKLPTIPEFILSEVVNGAIAYVGGETGKYSYVHGGRGDDRSYVLKMSDYFSKELAGVKCADSSVNMSPKILKALEEMTAAHFVHPAPESPYYECQLEDMFELGICDGFMRSSFSLSYELVNHVKNNVLPLFSEQERKDIEGIAKHMKKYIAEDVEFIRKTYFW